MPKTTSEEKHRWIKERIIELRKENKRCVKKLSWELEDEGISIHARTIGKIIKKEGLIRKYRTRKIKYKYIKIPLKQGELIEIDIKYVPNRVKGKRYYQFTVIDCASRWRYLQAYDDTSALSAMRFLKEVIK